MIGWLRRWWRPAPQPPLPITRRLREQAQIAKAEEHIIRRQRTDGAAVLWGARDPHRREAGDAD